MPKVNFICNSEKEYDWIVFFEQNFGEIDLPSDLRALWKDREKAIEYIEKSYDRLKMQEITDGWNDIEDEYFKKIIEITGHKWAHAEYSILVTANVWGFCDPINESPREVLIGFDISNEIRNYIIAHELFHAHYFHIAKKMGEDRLFMTELNENCAIFALLFTDMKELLVPQSEEYQKQMIESCINSHVEAAAYFPELKRAWAERKSFDDYLHKSLQVCKS